MPYSGINDNALPDAVLDLSAKLRRMWVSVFNSSYDEHQDDSRAAAKAWATVNNDRDKKAVDDERYLYFGGGVKAMAEEGRVGGYLVLWGNPESRDLQGEYFTKDTDFHLDWFNNRPVLYQHGLDKTMKSTRIGELVSLTKDDAGIWAEAQLDMRNHYVQKVWELAQRGVFGWSSGSLSHLVSVKGMQIEEWPLIEGSLTPTPADPRTFAGIQPLKALISLVEDAEESDATEVQEDETEVQPDVEESSTKAVVDNTVADMEESEDIDMNFEQALKIAQTLLSKLGQEMDADELEATIKAVLEGAEDVNDPESIVDAREQAAKMVDDIANAVMTKLALQERDAALEDETNRAAKAWTDKLAPKSKAPAGVKKDVERRGPDIKMRTQYDSLSAEDMSFMFNVQKMIDGWKPDQAFMRELADKATKAYQNGKIGFAPENESAAIKGMREWADMGGGRKSDEIDYSTQSSYGDEWVPTLWSDQLWETARIDNPILPAMRVIEMPSNPFEVPLESADPTVYYVPETTDESQLAINSSNNPMPDSKIGSSKVTLTAAKLALRVGFSSELVEDSIIPIIPQFRRQAMRTMMDEIDSVILNADDTASGNINYNGGTPATTASYKAQSYGLRHTAIVDNSGGNAVTAAGQSVTVRKLRDLRFALADAYAVRPDELMYITNASVMAKLLGMDEVLTKDKWGDMATISSGQFAYFDGSPFVVTAELGLSSSTTGKVSSTAGNNIYGSIVCVHRPSWVVGYRRRVRTVLDYYGPLDAYQMVMTVRMAIGRRDVYSASILYYLDV